MVRTSIGWRTALGVPLAFLLLLGVLVSPASARSRLGFDEARRGDAAASLSISPAVLNVGAPEIAIVLRNVGERELVHGYPFEVERRTRGRWVGIPTNTSFILPDLLLKPGAVFRQGWTLPGDLPAGRYRVVKKVGPFVLRAQFAVRAPRLGFDAQRRGRVAATLEVAGVLPVGVRQTPYVVRNTGERAIAFGADYRVQQRVGEQWVEVALGIAFPANLLSERPGGSFRSFLRLPRDLAPGRYRLVKQIGASRPLLVLRAEFDVVQPAGSPVAPSGS